MSSPSPRSPEQTEKSRKYDRQLRLWGEDGQKLLEHAKVCLINATALGTEILKSLILPGVGSFTIIDGEKVVPEDIGSNFFVEEENVGYSRAQTTTQKLLELNPDVRGDYIEETVEHLMAHTQDFFNKFSVVIATAVPEKVLIPLSRQLWSCGVPLIAGRTIGFLGYIRLQVVEHTVAESHPDNETPDLRLDKPWPALEEHLKTVDISKLGTKERSHVPALTILFYYLQQYRGAHNGALPKTRPEKEELKTMIRTGMPSDEGILVLEENFEQAIHFVNMCVTPTNVPQRVQNILNSEQCTNLTYQSDAFWVMCAALREFVLAEGVLPLRGGLPDMAADTQSYVALQQLYVKQAHAQAETVYRRAVQIAGSLGQQAENISDTTVFQFCKKASELHVIQGSSIADELQNNSLNISLYLEDPDSLVFYYVVLRGLEKFISEYNTFPGQFDDQVEPDILKVKNIIGKLMSEWGCATVAVSDERVHEVCRYGGAELHSVSAMLGGCAAHEVIKMITHQYVPINNTFIYDAITTSSINFKL